MKKIYEFFENMNEIVYASDVDNYQVVYMNKKARELYGYKNLDEVVGKRCYEVLQGSSHPCTICTNKKLVPGQFEEWKYFNPIVQKNFILKDTLVEEDGKHYRLELAIDCSTLEHQKQIINDYINNEALLNEALRMSLACSMPEESICTLLEYIGKALMSDRIYIFEENERGSYDNTYEWCAQGVSSEKESLQDVPRSVADIWLSHFTNNKNVIVSDIEQVKEEDPVLYAYLKPQNISSLVVSPLIYKNKVIGFYGVDNPPDEHLHNISTLFMIMGHFVVSLMRRRDLFKRLERLSFYDELTGCGNRHYMDDCIADIRPGNSIGVVYCDVTGLKRVNDLQGHKAGDALLVAASQCLKETFPTYPRFRIGGDEFLILCLGITEEALLQKEEQLISNMEKFDVIMAFGHVWSADSQENINKLIAEADRRMYENKRKYYHREA
jgi:diguanylate cyclase (GGDEF)-like protein